MVKLSLPLILCTYWNIACQAQNQLIGEWTNSYGSKLTISSQDQGEIQGIYASSTGSTGKYIVLGTCSPVSGASKNLSVALTILWNSMDSTTKDPSQFWTSVMIGTYYSEKNAMELINQISAAEEFQQVNIMEPGIYPESLTFNKKQTPEQKTFAHPPTPYGRKRKNPDRQMGARSKTLTAKKETNLLNGTWVNQETTSPYYKITIQEVEKNILAATITPRTENPVSSIGLTAKPAKKFQSLSLSSWPITSTTDMSSLWGITGLLNLENDQLKLIISQANNVAYQNKYASTDINVFYFNRMAP